MRNESASKKSRRKKGIYLLPNLLTTMNLFCGFYSMLASMQGEFGLAAVIIIIAMVLDSLDGRIARMTNTMSKFGAEYDSLSDLVTFGVAPAILAYSWALHAYGKWGWLASFLFVVCGALRLARFNIQIGIIESRVFNGLPIPASASVIATGIMLYFYVGGAGMFPDISVLLAVIALSLLMVSNIKYYSFKDLNFFSRKPFTSFVLIVIVMIIVAAEPQITLFTFSVGYSFSGPAWWLLKYRIKASTEKTEEKNKNAGIIGG
jgi:CDP-diacylglycerol---serine O-phosphatidyltransferase